MPPHGYIHVLSLTDKIAEFRNAIQKQKISGNIDTPEGGFDAMLQAAVCQVRALDFCYCITVEAFVSACELFPDPHRY